ncbi:unnamed protein product [Coffea canephora]|uniref:Uncharacterized protein n=1 Tax=Coffea canephora TaxID=49390 RepID=A0A068V7F0_COFCA|nr:unnamed protein product [Coffea canephora]
MICGNCAFAPLFALFYCSCSFARQKELPHKQRSSFSLAILNLPSFPVYWFGFNLHCCYCRCFPADWKATIVRLIFYEKKR